MYTKLLIGLATLVRAKSPIAELTFRVGGWKQGDRKIATLQVGSIMVCRFPMQKAKKRYINAIEVDWSKDSIRRNGQSEVPKDRKL